MLFLSQRLRRKHRSCRIFSTVMAILPIFRRYVWLGNAHFSGFRASPKYCLFKWREYKHGKVDFFECKSPTQPSQKITNVSCKAMKWRWCINGVYNLQPYKSIGLQTEGTHGRQNQIQSKDLQHSLKSTCSEFPSQCKPLTRNERYCF